MRTTDGGGSWVALPAPPAAYAARGDQPAASSPGVSEVRFADGFDGWLFGPSLFATHDGGRTWQELDLGGSVVSLEAAGGYVDAVVSPCRGEQVCAGPLRLEQARAPGGAFDTVLTGPVVSSSGLDALDLTLNSPAGFAVLGSGPAPGQARLYATANLGNPHGWKPFADPCASSAGLFLTSIVAPNSTDLYSLCTGNGALGGSTKVVVMTRNGASRPAGSAPAGGSEQNGTLAATSSGTLVIATASGASWLYRSADGGRSWTTADTFQDGGMGFNDLGFTTSMQGVVIHGVPGTQAEEASQLLMTHDAGASWHPVPIG